MREILSLLVVIATMSSVAVGGIQRAIPASLPAKVNALLVALN